MSAIEDKIKLLQRTLATMARLREILSYVEKLPEVEGHEGISSETSTLFKEFVDQQITRLEGGGGLKLQEPGSASVFSDDEVKILRSLIERVKAQNSQPPTTQHPPKLVQADRQDKIHFSMQNRHLENKRVEVSTKDGKVKGKVVGLDAPHVIVQTDTGYTVPVELEQVTVV